MKQKHSSVRWDDTDLAPPRADEIEISLFGPSYGESLLIHPGQGRWFVVDSCLCPDSSDPMPLEYLRRMGVNPENIERVIATHWDDDHVGGLAKVLRAAPAAKFVMSSAVHSEELAMLFRAYRQSSIGFDHGVREINAVFDVLLERGQKPVLAKANTVLWADQSFGGELVALSPSDALVIDGHLHAGAMIEDARGVRVRLVEPNRNFRSVVLFVSSGQRKVLLGADLEHSADSERGWTAILDSGLHLGCASLFKVPHHGSETGQCDRVWSEMLTDHRYALLTPWKKGGHIVPIQRQLQWLLRKSPQVYITAVPQRTTRKRSPVVERMIKATSEHLSNELSVGGHVRARAPFADGSQAWKIELYNGARQVDDKLQKAFPKG